jgi:hypothetical protein
VVGFHLLKRVYGGRVVMWRIVKCANKKINKEEAE